MSGDEVLYLECGGRARRYVAHGPRPAPAGPWPAVVMLDGRGGTPWTAMKTTGWSRRADAAGFLALYPEALRLDPTGAQHFLTNPQMWNAGGHASDEAGSGADDVAFLHAVLDDAASRFPVDPRRVHVAGFSNGAAMAYRFALAAPERVAAIAPVAGHFRVPAASLAEPVPLISFWGARDPLSPPAGGPVDLPWGAREDRPPARDSILAWAGLLGWTPYDAVEREDGGVRTWRFGAGDPRREVCFRVVEDLGHVWPGGHRLIPERLVGPASDRVDATAEIWDFFVSHPR